MKRNKHYWNEIIEELKPIEFLALSQVVSEKCKKLVKEMNEYEE